MISDFFGGNAGDAVVIAVKKSSDGGGSARNHAKGRVRAPAPEPQPDTWRLEPHVCRSCFSRLVSRPAETQAIDAPVSSARLYQCTNCGLEAVGLAPDVLCSCGMKIRRPTSKLHRSSDVVLIDAGMRCTLNRDVRADFAALYVAAEVA